MAIENGFGGKRRGRSGYPKHIIDYKVACVAAAAQGKPIPPEPAPPGEVEFITVQEAAKRFKVTAPTLWRWEQEGRFPRRMVIAPAWTSTQTAAA